MLDYLDRYTHHAAISNHRIIDVSNGKVAFRYRDRKDGDTLKVITVSVEEFIRRFMLHVLPDGYVRIRHFGFLANQWKKKYRKRSQVLGSGLILWVDIMGFQQFS